jgi:hypothetical protein
LEGRHIAPSEHNYRATPRWHWHTVAPESARTPGRGMGPAVVQTDEAASSAPCPSPSSAGGDGACVWPVVTPDSLVVEKVSAATAIALAIAASPPSPSSPSPRLSPPSVGQLELPSILTSHNGCCKLNLKIAGCWHPSPVDGSRHTHFRKWSFDSFWRRKIEFTNILIFFWDTQNLTLT